MGKRKEKKGEKKSASQPCYFSSCGNLCQMFRTFEELPTAALPLVETPANLMNPDRIKDNLCPFCSTEHLWLL